MVVLVYHTCIGRPASVDLFLKFHVLKLFIPDLHESIIFHDFPWPIMNFHDFSGLEKDILEFHDFPGFQ